jgi:hypothetical protein
LERWLLWKLRRESDRRSDHGDDPQGHLGQNRIGFASLYYVTDDSIAIRAVWPASGTFLVVPEACPRRQWTIILIDTRLKAAEART